MESYMIDNDHKCQACGEHLLFDAMWKNSYDNMFIVQLDENGEFVSKASSRSLEEMFDYDADGLEGVVLKNILDEENYNIIAKKYKKCIELNKALTYEERTKELEETLAEVQRLSIMDKLTGLYNRVKIDETLSKELKLSHMYNKKLGVILLDIDLFKNINDGYGHIVGDEVLKEFSSLLNSSVRETDTDGTYALAEHIRKSVSEHKFSKVGEVTASFGVTQFQSDDTPESIVKRADDAMYIAKSHARNCVIKK